MRLLFVATNHMKDSMPPMPLGLASIIGQIDESRYQIQVLDMMFCDQPEAELIKICSDFKPEIIALSIRNLDNQSYLGTQYFIPGEKKIVELCRSNSEATIIIGGPAFTVSPSAMFQYLDPDFGVIGEGEVVFPELLNCIESGSDFKKLQGLVWKGAGGVMHNPPQFISNLDELKLPRRDFFDNRRYIQEGGMPNILIKQGCSFGCLYCDGPFTMGSQWRTKSPETVVAEIKAIQKDFGAQLVYFNDAIFNYPVDQARAICQAIIDSGLKIMWVATVNPAYSDRSQLELMRKAGCVAVSPSCDSCSEKMLKTLRKNFTKAELESCLKMLEEIEIRYLLWLLIGGPGENRETVEETISFLENRNPMMLDFCVGIRLMPHSPLFDIAVREGVISADDPLMEPKFYISPEIEGWINDYLVKVCARHEKWDVKQR